MMPRTMVVASASAAKRSEKKYVKSGSDFAISALLRTCSIAACPIAGLKMASAWRVTCAVGLL